MSLLVGLRGQTRENEAAGLREGIIQQPGPFYNNNPSSIIWGNPPPSPLWRDDSGSPFFKTKYSGFGNSNPQQFGREEKQKEGSQMVVEGKTPFVAKRNPIHSESLLNLNSSPASSPFTFGFPPQQSSASSPSSALGSERSEMPKFGASSEASGSSFMTFGSNDFPRGTSAVGDDGLKTPSWAIPTSQDKGLKGVGMVTPVMSKLTLNEQENNPKPFADARERVGVTQESSPPPAMGFDLTGRFSSLGINNPHEPAEVRQDKPDVFVFGANLAGSEPVPAKSQSPDVAGYLARPRPVKVKRSVLTAKGKGIAAGNGTSSATSSGGLHVKGSRHINGEQQHSQPTIGLDQPPFQKSADHHENSAFQRFTSPTSRLPEQSNSVLSGRPSSASDQFSFSSGHRPFLNFEFGKSNRSTEESSVRLEDSNAAEALLSASTVKIDGSGSPLPSRNPNTESGGLDSSSSPSHSLNLSLGDLSDNASENLSGKGEFTSGHVVMKGQATEDLSSELALKLGLGSGAGVPEQGFSTGSNVARKSANTEDTESGVPSRAEAPSALNSANEEMKPTKESRDGESSRFSTGSSSTPAFSRFVKDRASEIPRRPFEVASLTKTKPDNLNARTEPFVFGASRNHSTSVRQRTVKSPSAFKSYGAFRSAPPSLNSSCDEDGGSKFVDSSASDLFSSKQKDVTSKEAAPFATDLNSLPFSFSAFNLGAAKPSVQPDEARGPDRVPPHVQRPIFNTGPSKPFVPSHDTRKPDDIPSYAQKPTTLRLSPGNTIDDSVDSTAYGSAPSRFIFSAGTGLTSSFRASIPAIPSENKSVNGFGQSATADSSGPSAFFSAQSTESQSGGTSSRTFEFRAGNDGSSESGKLNAARKTHRVHTGRRQTRSTAMPKERSNSFMSFGESASNFDEGGSPMDFSPQRYTPPDESIPGIQQTSERPAWENRSPSTVNFGLDIDDDWVQYPETEAGLENLRNAADDPAIGTRSGGRDAWKEMAKGENGSTWWIGKENVPRKSMGRSGKWKRAVVDENQVPLAGRDNTWSGVKSDTANRPDSGASSSTPSADSSASSSGWGQFTFTAGSASFSSTTSFLRRHARRIQRDKPLSGSGGLKSGSSKYKGESTPSSMTGLRHGVASTASTAPTIRPAFSFDGRVKPPVDLGKGFTAARSGNWDPARMPNAILSSGSNSWSSESSTSVGSLPRSDGAKPTSPQTVGAAATEQVCEKWRLRGNQAYADGDFPKAEEYYSRGASSVPPDETSQSCIRASMLCYSNRAATRMVVGRMREALGDCMRAMAVDPNFLRVRLRAASCHLALGETEAAALAFEECLRRMKEEDQRDSKVSSEASEGLRKSKQVDEYLDRAREILAKGSSGDTPTAMRLLNEALLSSPHSEKAIELKGRALLVLRRYEEVVQICEQSLLTAERNHPIPNGDSAIHQLLLSAAGDTVKVGGAAISLKMWRWQLTAKAKFYLGKLEETLEILQKSDEMTKDFLKDGNSSGCPSNADPPALSIGVIRDLLRHKAAGNDAFQSGKHTEAVEHYSAALACNGDSRPFNAVCFCNRAAASQALGNIADAISDCSRAIALDPKYAKAISRRATLHEKVRDYGQSCHDLQKLVALLESQQQQARAVLTPGWAGRPSINAQQDLWQARDRLAKAEDEMKKGHPLDHYMILGLEPGCSSNEIKKAYRKAALRHHPDKAGQFLGRSDGGDDGGVWKEVTDEVRSDAERLFKLIGEANAILSDNQKRSRYDSEEEFRKLRTRSSSAAGGFSDLYRGTERGHASSGRRPRERWDSWTGYGHQNQRWQSGPDAAQPDTYARRGRYGSNSSSRSNGDGGRWNDYDWDDM